MFGWFRLRKELTGCDFEMARMILMRQFTGAVIPKALAKLLDDFNEKPSIKTAAALVKFDSTFMAAFTLARKGGFTQSLSSRGGLK